MALLLQGRDLERTRKLLNKAIELAPSNPAAWKFRGLFRITFPKEHDFAGEDLKRYLEIAPPCARYQAD